MIWLVFWLAAMAVAVGALVMTAVLGRRPYKSGSVLRPANVLLLGVVLAAVLLFIPIYANYFKTTGGSVLETLLISVHSMIRLFLADGDFSFFAGSIAADWGWLQVAYRGLLAVVVVTAPVLTFRFVMSFFQNISAYKKLMTHYKSEVYVFSELNEKSLMLAASLRQKDADCLLVFADVFETDEEQIHEMVERTREIGAVCFKKDIVTIDFSFHSRKSGITFFAIGEDQSENISQALKIIANKAYGANTNLYVFSTQLEAESLLAAAYEGENRSGIRVRRVNEVQSLIFRTLYDEGYEKIFQSAFCGEDGLRHINALVVGMGHHGVEMTKALAWFCQMDGYRVTVNGVDASPAAGDVFGTLCPELMAPEHNGVFGLSGDANYAISIHSGVDVHTKAFGDLVTGLPRITYVLVALGEDEQNIATAIKLRMLFARRGYEPVIQSIVYNSDKQQALQGIKNYSGQSYAIDFIGDLRSSYSEKVIMDLDVEEAALARHLMWGEERAFWQYDYNYKSSMASAIHSKMKRLCGIPGIDKKPADRTEEERWGIRRLEHARWNAYMRAEGYVYGGSTERAKGRNDLAKMHNCLVPFEALSLKDQEKDDD